MDAYNRDDENVQNDVENDVQDDEGEELHKVLESGPFSPPDESDPSVWGGGFVWGGDDEC